MDANTKVRHIDGASAARIVIESEKDNGNHLADCDTITIALPNGRTVCVRVHTSEKLGTWGYVYVHAGPNDESGESAATIIDSAKF